MQRRRVRKKKSEDVKKEEQSDLLEKNDNKDERLGQGERELAAVISVIIKMTLITVCPKTCHSVKSVIIKRTLLTMCPKLSLMTCYLNLNFRRFY